MPGVEAGPSAADGKMRRESPRKRSETAAGHTAGAESDEVADDDRLDEELPPKKFMCKDDEPPPPREEDPRGGHSALDCESDAIPGRCRQFSPGISA